MKVAQLNTLNYGGAFVVASRLQEALTKLNHDCILLTKYGRPNGESNRYYLKDNRIRSYLRKNLSNPAIAYLVKIIQQVTLHPNLVNSPKGFEIFSPLYIGKLPRQLDILNDRDIIHLHWINDFIDMEQFFLRFSKKKFVWTLHDMNAFSGGCHHSDGCNKFETECKSCPQLFGTKDENYSFLVQKEKIKALEIVKDNQLVIVSPSRWLLELSKRSTITGRFKHMHINNLSFDVSNSQESRDMVKMNLGLNKKSKMILFVSDRLNNPRKGIQNLFNAILSISKKEEIVLVGVGHKAKKIDGLNIHYTGNIADINLLSRYYYAADLFVAPSLAENSPLAVIEALTCGTPVVATDIGGISELINERNGLLFPLGHVSELSKAVQIALYDKSFDRDLIRNQTIQFHHPLKIAEMYGDLYNKLLNS